MPIPKPIPKEVLVEWYVNQKKTTYEIQDKLHVTEVTVRKHGT